MYKIFNTLLAVSLFALLSACQSNAMVNMFEPVPTDTSLTTTVRDAFNRNGDPMLSNVHIETINSRVILSGYVKKIRQSDTAEMIAKHVRGVAEVENDIIVRP